LADALIIRRAMRPVIGASKMAMAIHPGQVDIRLPSQGLPTEIAPLVTAVNQALDRLEDGFRRQREFTADVAHDLRTPLAILRLRLDSLGDRPELDQLRADIDAMSRLVEQLLAMAELETFTVLPDERTDLRSLALEVASFLAPAAIAAGKEVSLSAGEAPIWVHGNSESLFRALRNLVENALAHSPPRGVVTIEVTPEGLLRVSDEGPGVPEDERKLIFQRSKPLDSRAHGGGLGLSIVARIVETHGGSIDVQSAQGGGACFVIRVRPY
jgi:signal transduction histidine kinase